MLLIEDIFLIMRRFQNMKLSRKRKWMAGIFIFSVAAVIFYLAFLIPHSISTAEIVEEGVRNERITTYPLPVKDYIFESLKLFLIINIPNIIFIIKKMNRTIVKGVSDK